MGDPEEARQELAKAKRCPASVPVLDPIVRLSLCKDTHHVLTSDELTFINNIRLKPLFTCIP